MRLQSCLVVKPRRSRSFSGLVSLPSTTSCACSARALREWWTGQRLKLLQLLRENAKADGLPDFHLSGKRLELALDHLEQG